MAGIPKYTPQVGTPSGIVRGASTSVPTPARMDLSGFDSFIQNRQKANEEADLNDARASLAAEEPKAQLALATKFNEIQQAWTPDSKPIAEQMSTAIDEVRADAETRITNPKAREALTARANEFRTHYNLQGFAFEQGKRVDARVSTYEQGYQDAANLGSTDPMQLGRTLATLNGTVMADTQIPEAAKREFIEKQSQAAALQVAKVQAEVAPDRVVAYAGSLLGIKEPALSPTAAGSKDIMAEIVKRESGGRMYAAGGEVLRGPAIKTRDGGTIHAYGPYQLLESTAQSQAKQAGVPWNPELFHQHKTGDPIKDATAREYHDLLGQSYIQQQNEQFGGDPVLIAAAHNMGPEATKGWAEGRPYQTQSGKWWYPRAPKDMSAMPEETKHYIQGLGVEEKPVAPPPSTPFDPDDEAGLAYRLLDTDTLVQVRSMAMTNLSQRRQQENAALQVQRDLFKQRVQDIETAAKNGDVINIPSDGELTSFLGPADAALTKRRLMNYQAMGGTLKQLPGLTNDELAAVTRAPNPEGSDDRENRQFVRDSVATQATRLLAARKADPGQAAMDTSPQVKQAFSAWSEAAGAFYQAGPQATPEQFGAMASAQAGFVREAFAQQKQWGIQQPSLPKDVIAKMAEGFSVQMERDPAQAAAYLARLPDLLGNEDATAQVANKIGSLGWLAMDGVPGVTLAKLRAVQATPEGKRAELLPEGVKKADVDRAVRAAFDPLMSTLAYQSDAVTAERYRGAGVALTIEKLSRGGSPDEAASEAYSELFGERNAVNGSYRVDTGKYDPEAVDRGLSNVLSVYPATGLMVSPEPGFTLEESQQRKLRTVRRQAFWVNNAAGTGVYLMRPTGPVLNANGVPIVIPFDRAQNSAPPDNAPVNDTTYRQARGF